jgi:hypothetical protein
MPRRIDAALALGFLVVAMVPPAGGAVRAEPARAAAAAQRPDARRVTPVKGTASISGRVVAADTGSAVRSAAVALTSPAAGTWTATTDAEGGFRFPDLPAGRYNLRVTKGGFATTSFGGGPRGNVAFELRDGQALDRGDLRLPRGGVIAGRVVDEHGEPMVDVFVSAMRSEYVQPGVRRLSAARSTQTNDLGEFRLHSLLPGKYYVSASLRMMQMVGGDGPPQQIVGAARGTAPAFYPGTASAVDAQPVGIAAGEIRSSVDMQLSGVPLAVISGTVIDSRGQPAPRMAVMLNPARLDGALIQQINMVETDAQGRFSLPNVAPGDYRLDVESVARMEAIGQTGSTARRPDAHEFASQPITVRGDDASNVVVQTSLGFRISGRVVVEGGSLTPEQLEAVQVSVLPVLAGQGISGVLLAAGAAAAPDGSFVVANVIGPRLIRVGALPSGYVLKSVRAYGSDITDSGIDVVQDVPTVEIVVTGRPTELSGTVTEAGGSVTTEYAVIVFSDDSRRWAARLNRHVTSARPGADGRFRVTGLPAGRYLAVAVGALVDGEWAEPDHLEQLRSVATRFELADGEARTVTLVKRQ